MCDITLLGYYTGQKYHSVLYNFSLNEDEDKDIIELLDSGEFLNVNVPIHVVEIIIDRKSFIIDDCDLKCFRWELING